ncbi:MAG: hypothetical protein IJY61_06250 [Candidatus Gastranaerophilales bacterium]|nr:hypothetical protein [Candidatus Gastranaerophilales bacterium]
MNISNNYTLKVRSSSVVAPSFKNSEKKYKDPLLSWPLKGLAFSNEIGAVIGVMYPKVGTALWAPALMYFGADIYDKYKNEETSYKPSARRGVKQAVFQAMSSVVLPTAAVHLGQKTTSSLGAFTKNGLTLNAREEVISHSLEYMQSKSLHKFVNDIDGYKKGFVESITTRARDTKGEFYTLSKPKKFLNIINPFKNKDKIAFANEKKLAKYAEKQVETIFSMRESLMKNQKPKQLSKKLFKKFQEIQSEYRKIYPEDKYLGKAAKSIIKEHHNRQLLNSKIVKSIGGFVALALLTKPIDDFVERVVIKKTVEPSLDYISNSYQTFKGAKRVGKSV